MAHGEWCLRPGEALDNNEYLQSQNGLFYAVMQPDGNFVIYRGEGWKSQEGQAMWSIRDDYEYGLISRYVEPGPYPGSHCAVMQPNGNFCVFNGVPAKEPRILTKYAWRMAMTIMLPVFCATLRVGCVGCEGITRARAYARRGHDFNLSQLLGSNAG